MTLEILAHGAPYGDGGERIGTVRTLREADKLVRATLNPGQRAHAHRLSGVAKSHADSCIAFWICPSDGKTFRANPPADA